LPLFLSFPVFRPKKHFPSKSFIVDEHNLNSLIVWIKLTSFIFNLWDERI
jgi:hypothetical protein